MSPEDAVTALEESGRKTRDAVRIVGYVAFAQHVGWDEVQRLMDEESFELLQQSYRDAGFDPESVDFGAFERRYIQEVARTSYHPRVRTAAKQLLARLTEEPM